MVTNSSDSTRNTRKCAWYTCYKPNQTS